MKIEKIINKLIRETKVDTNKLSDGYHTFEELYEHRIALFIVLCNLLYLFFDQPIENKEHNKQPWKSKLHFDGTNIEGWFIAGIGFDAGKQITYHIPLKYWRKLRVVAYDKAPVAWDGHTSLDALKRLEDLP